MAPAVSGAALCRTSRTLYYCSLCNERECPAVHGALAGMDIPEGALQVASLLDLVGGPDLVAAVCVCRMIDDVSCRAGEGAVACVAPVTRNLHAS